MNICIVKNIRFHLTKDCCNDVHYATLLDVPRSGIQINELTIYNDAQFNKANHNHI